jgi:leucyl aminopeptidase
VTNIKLASTDNAPGASLISSLDAEAVIVGTVPAGTPGTGSDGGAIRLAPGAEPVDNAFGGRLAAALAAVGATGKPGEVTLIPAPDSLSAKVVIAVGLGASDDAESLRRAAGVALRAAAGRSSAAVALPARDADEITAVATGALLGNYAFLAFRTGNGHKLPVPDLTVVAAVADESALNRARALADAVTLVRDMVNTPPSALHPSEFAETAERVAGASGLEIQVLDERELKEHGYGGITAVGQGSANPPRLVRMAYRHPGATRTVAFVGKGITFDSGGLSLKPPASMETMKSDMGGAAAVLGALQAVAALKPVVNVIGYMPLAENMPGGGAQRPSDVITIYGGKTVEVLNTDAEGRLVLADGIVRATEDEPDLIVDIATLTGAQVVALGMRTSGVMGNEDAARDGVAAAANRVGEDAWPMPLPAELRKGLDSPVADIANVSGDRAGGMLVAGLFLREFVPDGVRWAHIDIAGPSFNSAEPHGYTPKGGTGSATRALVRIAEDVAAGVL